MITAKDTDKILNRFFKESIDTPKQINTLLYDEDWLIKPLPIRYRSHSMRFYTCITHLNEDPTFKYIDRRINWRQVIVAATSLEEAEHILSTKGKDFKKLQITSLIRAGFDKPNTPFSNKEVIVRYSPKSGALYTIKTIKFKLKVGQPEETLTLKLNTQSLDNITIITEDRMSRKISLIQKLRTQSNSSMLHCKNVIVDLLDTESSKSDEIILALAMEELAKKKQIIASKKVGNNTSKYIILTHIDAVTNESILLKFGCESDQGLNLLRKEEKYSNVLKDIVITAKENKITSVVELLDVDLVETTSKIYNEIANISADLSEKVEIVSIHTLPSTGDIPHLTTHGYTHFTNEGDKVGGVLVFSNESEENKEIIPKLLHQLVYTNPLCLYKHELLPSVKKEMAEDLKNIILSNNILYTKLTSVNEEGKATTDELATLKKLKFINPKIMPSVVEGQLNKAIKEACFLEQDYLFSEDRKITVKALLEQHNLGLFDFIIT